MCWIHWRRVPKVIREKVYKHYRDGQCDDKLPSKEWLDAVHEAIEIVAEKENIKK